MHCVHTHSSPLSLPFFYPLLRPLRRAGAKGADRAVSFLSNGAGYDNRLAELVDFACGLEEIDDAESIEAYSARRSASRARRPHGVVTGCAMALVAARSDETYDKRMQDMGW